MKIWSCKIGEADNDDLPSGADGPMREAVAKAYRELTGHDADFCFSGWNGALTRAERDVADCTCGTWPHKPECVRAASSAGKPS